MLQGTHFPSCFLCFLSSDTSFLIKMLSKWPMLIAHSPWFRTAGRWMFFLHWWWYQSNRWVASPPRSPFMKYIRPFQTSKAHSRIFMDECFYICQLTPTWQDSASGCRDWKRCGNRTWLAKCWRATTFKGRNENKDDKSDEKSKAVQSNLLKLDHTDCHDFQASPPNIQEFVKCSLFCQPQLSHIQDWRSTSPLGSSYQSLCSIDDSEMRETCPLVGNNHFWSLQYHL